MKNTLLLLFIFTCFCQKTYSQQETWYFGYHGGLYFNGVASPVASATIPALITNEGSAVVQDANGNPVFYSDGITMWYPNHIPVINPMTSSPYVLKGHQSSTQSALIIPKPGTCDTFFVFTTDAVEHVTNGLCVTMVVKTTGGFLTVPSGQLNYQLQSSSSEKLAYYKGSNYFWLAGHLSNSATFCCYRVDASTTSVLSFTSPVLSTVGHTYGLQGQMKISPSGNYIAMANGQDKSIECFNFNIISGGVGSLLNGYNNAFVTPVGFTVTYGLEFSPNERYIYISTTSGTNYLHRFDILGTGGVAASPALLYSGGGLYGIGGLQSAPNGKIYIARTPSEIANPNSTVATAVGVGLSSVPLPLAPTTGFGLGTPVVVTNIAQVPPVICSYPVCDTSCNFGAVLIGNGSNLNPHSGDTITIPCKATYQGNVSIHCAGYQSALIGTIKDQFGMVLGNTVPGTFTFVNGGLYSITYYNYSTSSSPLMACDSFKMYINVVCACDSSCSYTFTPISTASNNAPQNASCGSTIYVDVSTQVYSFATYGCGSGTYNTLQNVYDPAGNINNSVIVPAGYLFPQIGIYTAVYYNYVINHGDTTICDSCILYFNVQNPTCDPFCQFTGSVYPNNQPSTPFLCGGTLSVTTGTQISSGVYMTCATPPAIINGYFTDAASNILGPDYFGYTFTTCGTYYLQYSYSVGSGPNSTICQSCAMTIVVACATPCTDTIHSTAVICPGASYTFGSQTLNSPGVYYDTVYSATAGVCDTIKILTLTLSNQCTQCDTSCHFRGTIAGGGIQQLVHCGDSINLRCNTTYYTNFYLSCGSGSTSSYLTAVDQLGNPVAMPLTSVNFPTAGDYVYTFYNTYGNPALGIFHCDSCKVKFHVTCSCTYTLSLYDTICQGGSYNFDGQVLTNAGVYMDTIHGFAAGLCDTIKKLTLTVNTHCNQCDTSCHFRGTIAGGGIQQLVHCGDSINLRCNTTYYTNFYLSCGSGSTSSYLTAVDQLGNPVTMPLTSVNFPTAGDYVYTFYNTYGNPAIGIFHCDSCKIKFHVTCASIICPGGILQDPGFSQPLGTPWSSNGTGTATIVNYISGGCFSGNQLNLSTSSLQTKGVIEQATIKKDSCYNLCYCIDPIYGAATGNLNMIKVYATDLPYTTTQLLTPFLLTASQAVLIDQYNITNGNVAVPYTYCAPAIFHAPYNYNYFVILNEVTNTYPYADLFIDNVCLTPATCGPRCTVHLFDTASICHGGVYSYGTHQYTQSGMYHDTIFQTQSTNCDTIKTLTLTVLPIVVINITDTICQGNTYLFDGQILTNSGIYTDTINGANMTGCDSIRVLTLTVRPNCNPCDTSCHFASGYFYPYITNGPRPIRHPMSCGSSYSLTCGQLYYFTMSKICHGSIDTVRGVVKDNIGNIIYYLGPSNPIAFYASGTYTITYYISSGTGANQIICDSCQIRFVVACSPCGPGGSGLLNAVIINTGYNHLTSTTYPYTGSTVGAIPSTTVDQYWSIVSAPAICVSAGPFPKPAYVVDDMLPYLTSATAISASNIGTGCTNDLNTGLASIVFERRFCMVTGDSVSICGSTKFDNSLCMYVDGTPIPITYTVTCTNPTNCDDPCPGNNLQRLYPSTFCKTVYLSAGTHTIQLRLRSNGGLSTVMVQGSVMSATGLANNFLCPDSCGRVTRPVCNANCQFQGHIYYYMDRISHPVTDINGSTFRCGSTFSIVCGRQYYMNATLTCTGGTANQVKGPIVRNDLTGAIITLPSVFLFPYGTNGNYTATYYSYATNGFGDTIVCDSCKIKFRVRCRRWIGTDIPVASTLRTPFYCYDILQAVTNVDKHFTAQLASDVDTSGPVRGILRDNAGNNLGTVDSVYRFTHSGTYSVTYFETSEDSAGVVTNLDSCKIYINASLNTGIDNINAIDQVKLYPNPVNNTLHIVADNGAKVKFVSILNVLGQVLSEQVVLKNETEVDMSSLASATYLIRVVMENGEMKYYKIVKE